MAPPASSPSAPAVALRRLAFDQLTGWRQDAHEAALAAFLLSARSMVSAPPQTGGLGVSGPALAEIARRALAMDFAGPEGASIDRDRARAFFEAHFQPMAVASGDEAGFLTGYFEPEVEGSLTPTERFRWPLLARPDDLVDVDPAAAPPGWDPDYRFARQVEDAVLPYYDRGEIEDGALAGRGLEIVYLADPVDVYFIHVQGSVRVRLTDGGILRLAYAAKAGHPYTSLGKRLIERGDATAETMTLDRLRAWLTADPAAGRLLMRENRSYVFFKTLDQPDLDPELGAVAAAGVQITPGRSLAVDHRQHTYGTPVWIEADLPAGATGQRTSMRRLLIAQDTGSAIVGAARGDIFFGLGVAAEREAGRIRHRPEAFVVLMPRDGS